MIILDTNVISEVMRERPAPEVLAWLERQPHGEMFTTAVTVAEILAGIALMPEGRRRDGLANGARLMFDREFAQRVLPFDRSAAETYAGILATRSRSGKPIKELDAQIVSIARTRKMKVATRNVSDFSGCGVEIINPWDSGVT
jgi:predicted nucleic acid-binding protein